MPSPTQMHQYLKFGVPGQRQIGAWPPRGRQTRKSLRDWAFLCVKERIQKIILIHNQGMPIKSKTLKEQPNLVASLGLTNVQPALHQTWHDGFMRVKVKICKLQFHCKVYCVRFSQSAFEQHCKQALRRHIWIFGCMHTYIRLHNFNSKTTLGKKKSFCEFTQLCRVVAGDKIMWTQMGGGGHFATRC